MRRVPIAPTEAISICIPTYRRPELLRRAVESVVEQTFRDVEIVIGDDSPDDETERTVDALRSLATPAGIAIDYRRHRQNLGQSANVDELFHRATCTRLVLLHDDDVLVADGLVELAQVWIDGDVVLAFGKQEVIDHEGRSLPSRTIALNREYERDARTTTPGAAPLAMAFRQQIPNDGFLVRTDVAREIGYRSPNGIVTYCDLDFNLRLARGLQPGDVVYVDSFVSGYRETETSVSRAAAADRTPDADRIALYDAVRDIPVDVRTNAARRTLLRRLAGKTVKALALNRRRRDAWAVYASDAYPIRERLSMNGLYHLALIAFPAIEGLRRRR